jgi:NADP-dependent 3-hydroxy acid dehydrogenase YdfG
MENVRDTVAFITGGASGIGLGIAATLVDAGVKAVLADLRQDHIDAALAGFARCGQAQNVHAIHVTDRSAMAAGADEAERVFGKV